MSEKLRTIIEPVYAAGVGAMQIVYRERGAALVLIGIGFLLGAVLL